jgi:serine kinase of HPr protein (carbohydrate metabolism regulator)
MTADEAPTVHASAVLAGARAVLIRGPAGSGKSRLALGLIEAAAAGILPFARLVGDDRIAVQVRHGRVLLSPPAALQGWIEVRGLGIRQIAFERLAVAGLVVDLGIAQAERLPDAADQQAVVSGIALPRLAVQAASDPLPLVLACLRTQPADPHTSPGAA